MTRLARGPGSPILRGYLQNCLLGSFSRARLRIYEAMGGKSHDMSFCVEVKIRQWNSSTANKTYPQDAGTGRC